MTNKQAFRILTLLSKHSLEFDNLSNVEISEGLNYAIEVLRSRDPELYFVDDLNKITEMIGEKTSGDQN